MPTKTNIVVDTNIFLYALDDQNLYHSRAATLLNNPSYTLHMTTKNVSEYFAVASKLNIDFVKAFAFYKQICTNATLLFTDNQSLLVFENLLQKYQPRGNKVFDLEIVSIALAHQISIIATVNAKDFDSFSEITVLSI